MISENEEIAEMIKLMYLIREKSRITFISNWKSLMVFLLKKEKNPMIYGFKD